MNIITVSSVCWSEDCDVKGSVIGCVMGSSSVSIFTSTSSTVSSTIGVGVSSVTTVSTILVYNLEHNNL